MKNSDFVQQIRNFIAKDQLGEALKQLQLLLKDSPRLNEAILQSGRFADIQQQIRMGIISTEDANLTKNQIRTGLLNLLSELECDGADTEIRAAASEPQVIQNAEKIYNINHIDNANFS